MKRFLTTAIFIFAVASPAHSEVEWAVAKHEYKGFPLFLRYAVGLNYDAMQAKYPLRIVVTLKFAETLENGLPEGQYNRTLETFDEFVTRSLSAEHGAQCVLIETFGGKRIFYAYTAREAVASTLRTEIKKRYSKHSVSVELEPDPNWSLIRNYAAEYFPNSGVAKNGG